MSYAWREKIVWTGSPISRNAKRIKARRLIPARGSGAPWASPATGSLRPAIPAGPRDRLLAELNDIGGSEAASLETHRQPRYQFAHQPYVVFY